jgi:hypothetical protein
MIKLFPLPSENQYVAYKLTQVTYQVTDNQTGLVQSVQGLGGSFANRPFPNQPPPPIPPDPYCLANSKNISPDVLKQRGLCNGNLSSAGGRQDYVGVSDNPCMNLKPTDPNYFTCGKPLVNMNLPGNNVIGSLRKPNPRPGP